jgi:cephalosporin hydroxylase
MNSERRYKMSASGVKKPNRPQTSRVHPGYSRHWYQTLAEAAAPEWMGVPIVKHPNDLIAYQQIIFETKPDLIIETGSFVGGSALYMATVCDMIGHGQVLSIDIAKRAELPTHTGIDFLIGLGSTDPELLDHVRRRAEDKRCMVILDSAHNANHVYNELRAYAPLVARGCYLIVEDTNRDGYTLGAGDIIDGQGPAEALRRFQPTNRGFEVDRRFEQWGFTQNPNGYLRRRSNA